MEEQVKIVENETVKELSLLLEQEESYFKRNKLKIYLQDEDYYCPNGSLIHGLAKYPKFKELFDAGNRYKQRSVIAGNRVGKTLRTLSEVVLHCVQEYPDNWTGRRYARPLNIIIGADTGQTAQRIFQPLLLGDNEEMDGLIPADALVSKRGFQGIPGCYSEYKIKGKNGISTMKVITYHKGREAFEGFKADIIYLDEECPRDILSEASLRTMTVRDGIILASFTPDRGLSDTYLHFSDPQNPYVYNVNVTWDDVPHLSSEEKAEMLASLPPHERECRSKGIPYLGSGKIYQVLEDDFVVKSFELPRHWARCFGMDIGYKHPTAITWGAWDRDSDIVYIYSEYRQSEVPPSTHASAILSRGKWIPGVLDTTASVSNPIDGRRLIDIYNTFDLNLYFAKKGKGSVEEGILEVYDRLATGRLKVFDTCRGFIEEYRLYRRNDRGLIHKEKDDLLDAMRYMLTSGLQIATIEPNDNLSRRTSITDNRCKVTGY